MVEGMEWLFEHWSEVLIIATLLGSMFKVYNIFIHMKEDISYRLGKIERSIDHLRIDGEERKEDYVIIFKGLCACLDGLQQQGVNGPVTQAKTELQNHLYCKMGQ